MNTVAGIVAGFLLIGGAAAIYRFGKRKAGDLRRAINEFSGAGHAAGETVLDFVRDPQTGVYKSRT